MLGANSGRSVVVDPGPDMAEHLDAIVAAAGEVELVIFTHEHIDHTESIDSFVQLTGAPARALRAEYCRNGAPVIDGEVIEAAGTTLRILATPGHTSDSISIVLPEFGEHGAVLTGDTILGGSTTVIVHPDGSIADYLESLDKIEALGDARIFPGHGPEIASAADEARKLRAHRKKRLAQVEQVVAEHPNGDATSVEDVLAIVYADAPQRVLGAARLSIEAQLQYLRG
ncbi:MBL fold metallo-hydrolase [Gulosibacter molinativorax]|uniref:MBL fold metallo-hydrolase n=1 Tax=Gulosibacter molinativorax TaxID=256821 RepID=UPI001FE0BB62|nr:MBL fold metallo-hydrolase [Gulosibacter molinativorax]